LLPLIDLRDRSACAITAVAPAAEPWSPVSVVSDFELRALADGANDEAKCRPTVSF
jgi:hypothetical protein